MNSKPLFERKQTASHSLDFLPHVSTAQQCRYGHCYV